MGHISGEGHWIFGKLGSSLKSPAEINKKKKKKNNNSNKQTLNSIMNMKMSVTNLSVMLHDCKSGILYYIIMISNVMMIN